MNNKVAITTTSFAEYDQTPLSFLKENGFEFVLNHLGRKLSKRETIDICNGCTGIVAGTEVYDRDTLEQLKGVCVISRCGVGTDNIDLEAAKEIGMKVLNTPYGPTLAVAELTVGLMLNMIRKVNFMDRELKAGTWKKRMGNLLRGKKIGIIGFGKIGQKVAELLIPFGVDVAYYDISIKQRLLSCLSMYLTDLLKWADIVTLHCTGEVDNKAILGHDELKQMKKGAFLINTSRGRLVDETALHDFLREGHLSGAALDVFREEPYDGPLLNLDNVILTPHVGSYAKESRIEMEIQAVKNIMGELKNR